MPEIFMLLHIKHECVEKFYVFALGIDIFSRTVFRIDFADTALFLGHFLGFCFWLNNKHKKNKGYLYRIYCTFA